MILILDTSDGNQTTVRLENNGQVIGEIKKPRKSASQAVLPLTDSLMKKHATTFFDIQGIRVHTGPGSFTGLRVGAAVANALGWLLDVPVNGEKGKSVEPLYGPSSFLH